MHSPFLVAKLATFRFVVLGLGLLFVATGCSDNSQKKKVIAAESISDVMRALTDRTSQLTAIEVDGVYRPKKEGGLVQHYTYLQRFPNFIRVDVKETKAHFIFDGTTLTLIKDDTKTVLQQKLDESDPAQAALLMRTYFGAFLTEGWRMPLLSPNLASARLKTSTEKAPEWHVQMPVTGTQIEHHYKLRAPKADFVGSEVRGKGGKVLKYIKVLEEYDDPGTRLHYPKKWEIKDNVEHAEIELLRIQINHDLPKDRFKPSWPADYTVREASKPKTP
ncbi:MAG: hypothetical protein GY822_07765 [Deltaproteobacteria bacterium]|nr:hypothetical protein [Deltaproteobacteria bacterium]